MYFVFVIVFVFPFLLENIFFFERYIYIEA